MRTHLASLVEDFRAQAAETAVVSHRGVRRYATSYGDLARLAGRFAAELERRDIGAGERVVLWGANSAEWIGVFFGCLLRGVLVVPLDATGSTGFAQRILAEVSPRLLVGDASLLRGVETEAPKLVLAELAATLPRTASFAADASVQEDAPFQIVFTSGTTAEPKGIVHTHRNVLASLRPMEAEMRKYRRYERWVHPLRLLHTLPLSHVFGQFLGLWIPVLLGAELHLAEALEPARMLDVIGRERISVLIAVPRVLGILRAHLLQRFPELAAELELSAGVPVLKRWWRFRAVHRAFGWKFWAVISGGASLPADLESFWNRLGFALIQGYGMTETAALVTLNHPFRIGQGTIGKALPGREVQLSETGEIQVRGDMVSKATWRDGRMERREGEWLATGDLAERSDSGDLRFVGRKGEAIITSSGLNLHPSDLESAMLRQRGVRACAVVPCERASGVEPVCVVAFSGDDAALERAVREANGSLMEYQRIRRTLRWPELDLPYTSTGKLLRRTIKDWACSALRQAPRADDETSDALLSLIANVTGVKGTGEGDDLRLSEDLFLDSLGRVQLASALEQRTGVELPEREFASIATLGELRAMLGAQAPALAGATVARDMAASRPPARAEAHTYPRWPWSWPVAALRIAVLEAVVRPLIGLLLRPRVIRPQGNLPPGPLLIIANHVTALDGALVLFALPGRLRRRIAIAMSGEMLLDLRFGRGRRSSWLNLFAPVAYWLLTTLFNVFPLPRLQGFRRSFAHAGEAMDQGYSILVFPEGTRSRSGALGTFRPGIGLLTAQLRVPVLPVALVGMETLRGGRGAWFRSSRLAIRLGETITMPEGAEPAAWSATLQQAMLQLL